MSLEHIGTCHLAKARPQTNVAADGTWSVTLRAVDRFGAHQAEAWTLIWAGEAARAWWALEGHTAEPGDTIRVRAHHARVHSVGRDRHSSMAELQAHVQELQIVARARKGEPA